MKGVIAGCLFSIAAGVAGAESPAPVDAPPRVGEVREGRRLVWSDEFAYEGLPDSKRWTYEEGRIRNREAQYYTRGRRENARVENGLLVLEGRREAWEGAEFTSASVITKGLAAWKHVRVEVRGRVPRALGTWPAFWMLGLREPPVGWPECGEIDIMEHWGHTPGQIQGTIHTGAFNHVKGTHKAGKRDDPTVMSRMHVYAIDWTAEKIDFLFDGEPYFTYGKPEGAGLAEWPFDAPHYLLLNLAVGGTTAKRGIDVDAYPQRLEVDWVRVWERAR